MPKKAYRIFVRGMTLRTKILFIFFITWAITIVIVSAVTIGNQIEQEKSQNIQTDISNLADVKQSAEAYVDTVNMIGIRLTQNESVRIMLSDRYPELSEGELSKMRASIVCEPTLALCAGDIELGGYLLLGKGEEATGGRGRNSVVSDAMEALIGAIYLDGGFASVKEFIHGFVLNDIEHKQLFFDSKTILQEMVQASGSEPLSYELIREEGPDHNKTFEARALVGLREIGRGTGRTKKAAESMAAYRGILWLKGTDYVSEEYRSTGV